ncbi:MAG: CHAT domain-containing protein, partial [Planctomycetota bacterium]
DPARAERLEVLRAAELDARGAFGTDGRRNLDAIEELAAADPELGSLITVQPRSADDLRALLHGDETLLEFYGHGEQLYVVTAGTAGVELSRLDGAGLVDDVRDLREAIDSGEPWRELSRSLYDRLLKPVASRLRTPRLVIVPHGVLHYLPFAALDDGEQMLIDRFRIRVLPNTSVIPFLNDADAQGSALVLGNPDRGDPGLDLPGAEREALAISEVLTDARIRLRGDASESALRGQGQQFRIVHIASHGQFRPDSPLSSRLLLAGDDRNDGDLTAAELYTMRLSAELVTLSACETGLGEVASGDDVLGLTRGFLYAGADSVLASLWEVDDAATAMLMSAFYRHLGSTDRADALRRAQLETRERYPDAFFWAAFQLVGAAGGDRRLAAATAAAL